MEQSLRRGEAGHRGAFPRPLARSVVSPLLLGVGRSVARLRRSPCEAEVPCIVSRLLSALAILPERTRHPDRDDGLRGRRILQPRTCGGRSHPGCTHRLGCADRQQEGARGPRLQRHRGQESSTPLWHVQQGVLSEMARVSVQRYHVGSVR